MPFTVSLEGREALLARLTAMGPAAADALEDALRMGAMLVENEAKTLAPRRTGTLARSITTVTVGKTATSVRLQVGTQVEYGAYVEYGTGVLAEGGGGRQTPWVYRGADGGFYTTSGQAPRPYLRPAFDSKVADAQAAFFAAIQQIVSRP